MRKLVTIIAVVFSLMLVLESLTIHAQQNQCTATVAALIDAVTKACGTTPPPPPPPPPPPDTAIRIPANYTNFAIPAKGGSFNDSAFGTRITRISDPDILHEYSTMNPFNTNETRMLLLNSSGFFIVDRAGTTIVNQATLQIGAGANARWSRTGNGVYYFAGNRIMHFDVDTRQRTTYHTFTQYQSIGHGGGIADISRDNRMVFIGNNNQVGLFDLDTKTITGVRGIPNVNTESGVDVSPSGRYVILAQGAGDTDFEVYDEKMVFQRRLSAQAGHFDMGIDTDVEDVILTFPWSDSTDPPGCETNGVIKIRIRDGAETCIFKGMSGTHLSSTGDTPWVLVGTIGNNGTAGGTLPADWQKRWRVYENELFLVRLDGSQVKRALHHRTRTLDEYYFNPHAALSRSATWIMFSSNVGTNRPTQYIANLP